MKFGRFCRWSVLGLFSSFAGQAALGQNLVVNPGFETGNFNGWALSGSTSFEGVSTSFASTPNSGAYSAFFGAVGSYNIISQTIATTPGDTYNFSFALDNSGGPFCEAYVDWNCAPVWDVQPTGTFGWTEFGWNQVATSTSTTISFGFQQVPSYFNLDDVSLVDLTPHPVVTPPSGSTDSGGTTTGSGETSGSGGAGGSDSGPVPPPYVPVLNTSNYAPPIPDPPKLPDQGVGILATATTLFGLCATARRRQFPA